MTDIKNPPDLNDEPPSSDPGDESASSGSGIHSIGDFFRVAEIDTRLLGMIVALFFIWVGFNILSG